MNTTDRMSVIWRQSRFSRPIKFCTGLPAQSIINPMLLQSKGFSVCRDLKGRIGQTLMMTLLCLALPASVWAAGPRIVLLPNQMAGGPDVATAARNVLGPKLSDVAEVVPYGTFVKAGRKAGIKSGKMATAKAIKRVGKKLNIDFIDIDQEIEKNLGMTISKIFEIKGEKYFRKIEETITLKILKKNKMVISLGGGAFLNNKIKKEILDNHISFWLNWDIQSLINRIKDSKKRPVAFNATTNELTNLIKKRSIVYSKAMYKIDCENLSKNEVVNNILKIYEAH